MRAKRSSLRSPASRLARTLAGWVAAFVLLTGVIPRVHAQVWDTIPPADMKSIGLDAFADSEIDLPFYVANFHKIATAVEPEDPNRGFIRASVWQPPSKNKPYNARVMENILSLAFFYTQKRPWNPWYGSQQLRHRLEAALSFWIHMQGPQGEFSEDGPQRWSLAATASATKFMGETLHYLKEGPPINEDLLRQVVQAHRNAILSVLYNAEFYEQGKRAASDYSGVWAGALAYLALYPDEEMRNTLGTRMRSGMHHFQSPFGYFYNDGGPDMGEALRTHFSNLRMAWHYAQGSGMEPMFIDMMKEFYVWLVWNVSIEKDRSGYYLNAAINTRGTRSYLSMDDGMPYRNGLPLAETVRLGRAFQLDETARAKWISDERKRLAQIWPNLPDLEIDNPDGYNPETFLHRRHRMGVVTQDLFREALTALPCADSHPFNHVKQVSDTNSMFYYANRPGAYYVIFAGGESVHPRQSLGITLIRSHSDGTVLLSQAGNATLAWGTRPGVSEDVYESTRIFPAFRTGTQDIEIKPGPNSMAEGEVVLSYAIGAGTKVIRLSKDRIEVEIQHQGSFTEQLPLLIPDNERVDLKGNVTSKGKFRIEHRGATATLGEAVNLEGPRKIQPLLLQAKDSLKYTIRF